MLLLAATVLAMTTPATDSIVVRVSLASASDRPPLEWVITDSASVPVETGKTPGEFARDVRGQTFVVCGTRPGEWLSVHIQISQSMALDGSAECMRFGHQKGKIILEGVRRAEVRKPGL